MNEIILNENSLCGQYASMDEFYRDILPFLSNVQYFVGDVSWEVLKKSDLFQRPVTKNERFFRIRGDRSDAARKIKGLLCRLSDEPPYWDVDSRQKGIFHADGRDVTGSSVAEAAARTGFLLSFPQSAYEDRELTVTQEEKEYRVTSITTPSYRTEQLYQRGFINIYTYLRERFRGTRLNFDEFDVSYGFDSFEKDEVAECIRDFERFAGHADWQEIKADLSLYCKEYQPSPKENWFRGIKYVDMTIYKFRCGNPKRCFGYRKGDVFYALRMERDHKISDKG